MLSLCMIYLVFIMRCESLYMPSIIESPNSDYFVVQNGGSIQVKCNASGNPKPVVHWVRLDSSLSDVAVVNNGSLSILNFNTSDSGLYVCVAINSVGMDVSNITTFATNMSVSFGFDTVNVDDHLVFDEDDTAFIACCADKIRPRETYWFRQDSQSISVDTTGLTLPYLVIPMFSSYDESIYFCLSGDEYTVSTYSFKVRISIICNYSLGFDTDQTNTSTVFIADGDYDRITTVFNRTGIEADHYFRIQCCTEYSNYTITWERIDGQNAYYEYPQLYDNVYVDGGHDTDLFIGGIENSSNAYYACIAFDDEGCFYSARMFDMTFDDVNWAGVDRTIEVYIGDSIVLDCCINDGVVCPDFEWFENAVRMSHDVGIVSRDRFLFLTNLTEDDNGNLYTCITGKQWETVLYNVLVIVTEYVDLELCKIFADANISNAVPYTSQKPKITGVSPPDVVIVQDGYSTEVNCSASGIPEPVLHWVRLDSSLSSLASSVNGSLYISNFSAIDSGIYVCVAVNNVGMDVSNITMITIVDAPSMNINTVNIDKVKEINENDTAILSCCSDEVKPMEKSWIRYGSLPFAEDATGLSMYYLVIPMFSLEDEGIYYCLSGNEHSISTYSWKIRQTSSNQLVRGTMVSILSDQPIQEGDYVHIACISSNSFTDVQWIRPDRGEIPQNAIIVNQLDLVILSVAEIDFGLYTCIFFNNNGFSIPEAVRVGPETELNLRLEADFANEILSATANDTVLIDCCIEGDVTNYKWYRNRTNIPSGSEITGSQSRTLIVPNVQEEDIGLYTCVAGKTNHEFRLYNVLILLGCDPVCDNVEVSSSLMVELTSLISSSSSTTTTTSSVLVTATMPIPQTMELSSSIHSSYSIYVTPQPSIAIETNTDDPNDIDGNIIIKTGNQESSILDSVISLMFSIFGFFAIATLGAFSIVYVCCKRGLFGHSQIYRILKTKEPRLWDIIMGRHKETLLSQAIQIIDRVDAERTKYDALFSVQNEKQLSDDDDDDDDDFRNINIDWTIRRPYCPSGPRKSKTFANYDSFLKMERGISVENYLNSLQPISESESLVYSSPLETESINALSEIDISSSDTFYSV